MGIIKSNIIRDNRSFVRHDDGEKDEHTDKSITTAYGPCQFSSVHYAVREKGPKNSEPQLKTQRFGNKIDDDGEDDDDDEATGPRGFYRLY